jgi:TonB family protein
LKVLAKMKVLFKLRLTSVLIAVVSLCVGFASAKAQQTKLPDETARAVALFQPGLVHAGLQDTQSAARDTETAIGLYQQGKIDEALPLLQRVVKVSRTNLYAWHYLGLALEKKGDVGEAGKAHAMAAELGDDLLTNALDQNKPNKEIIKDVTLIRDPLTLAARSGVRFVALHPKLSGSKRQEWEIRIYSLHEFANIETNPEILSVSRPQDSHEKARVLSKPDADYTVEARNNGISGTVILKAVFSLNGRVIRIHATEGLRYGLTAMAIAAARGIKFIPARKDGKPVSMYVQLEYTFKTN